MERIFLKERWIRFLPGRLRVEVYGLKGNRSNAQKLEKTFSHLEGISIVRASADTGRLLVTFDEGKISSHLICQHLQRYEEEYFIERHPDSIRCVDKASMQEVATASAAVEVQAAIPETFTVVPGEKQSKSEAPPAVLTASVIGLGVLGVKQAFMGKSSLAANAGLFHAAGMLSIITGYPMLKKGFENLSRNGSVSADLVLGSAAVALALVRENLLALAGASLIQFLHWQRKKNQEEHHDPSFYLSKKTKAYADRATKWAFGLAGLTYAVTRNPLVTMGVLLAANPRPCLAAEEYNWKQAEHTVREQGLLLPRNQTLRNLAELDHLVIEDTSLLFSREERGLSCISNESEDKIWCLAGSLLSKSNHPFTHEIVAKAEKTGRTKRTPFDLEETAEGIKGKINGQEVAFGTMRFMQRNGVDCQEYELAAKRHKRSGCDVYFLSKNRKCLGLILSKCPVTLTQAGNQVVHMQTKFPHLKVAFQSDSLGLHKEGWLQKKNWELLDPTTLPVSGPAEQTSLLVTKEPSDAPHGYLPSIPLENLAALEEGLSIANEIEQMNDRHRKWTVMWNILGTALVIPGRLAAPLVNLMSDALKLVMLTRSKKASDVRVSRKMAKASIPKVGEVAWHALSEEELLIRLQTNRSTGLSEEAVVEFRSLHGLNQVKPPEKPHWFMTFLKQFSEFTTLILIGTAAVSILSGDVFDGLAMTAVLLANAVISVVQEKKAGKVVDALNQFQPPMSKVIRNGQERELSASQLVPGDLVVLEAGDRVPADIRILEDWNLEVNEAPLTGESLAVKKSAGITPWDSPLAERTNMLYMGTNVTRGKSVGLVVETGMNTEIGYLTSLLKEDEQQRTPLQDRVTSISKKFVKGAFLAGSLVFVVGLLRGNSLRQMVSTSVALIASAIPEGLPVTITIALSAGIYRMSRRNAVIRKLSAFETLGRVTVICSDKTGTLTKNEMTVTKVATVNKKWNVTGEGYSPVGEILLTHGIKETADEDLNKLLQIGVFCNNSQLIQEGDQWLVKGDPTEGALLSLSHKAGLTSETLSQWKRRHEIPFDSFHGTMSVVCDDDKNHSGCFLMSKGSIEAILKKCSHYQVNGQICPLTEEVKEQILHQNHEFASQALRVLGFAYRPLHQGESFTEDKHRDLIYVGMVGMIDPPKAEVEEAIQEAYRLGVKPVMITGDHPVTAIAIGRQLGMYREGDRVVTGSELDQLTDDQLTSIVSSISIFARVSPEHKLRIVQAYQHAGHTVAMTGDGVNDAPAIRKANVGIAMGRTGTEVTKQTADMVLKEDHFGTIVDGVKESRTIISNIRKAIGCLLTGNLAEILVSSLAVIAGLPIPLVPVQILLMNLLTDALPAAVLAVNPGNKKLITERQNIVDKRLYQKVAVRGLVLGLGALGLFAGSLAMGAPLAVARTMAFATLVAGQLMQTFSWRQENGQHFSDWTRDRFFMGALGISWAALLAVMYVPALAQIFHTAPLQVHQMAFVILVGGSVSLLSKPLIDAFALAGGRPQPLPDQHLLAA
jgi:Ca2+-transporting ATPase